MDLELYQIVRKAEQRIKDKYKLKDFNIYIPTIEMDSFCLVFQENENNSQIVESVINDFVEILKSKGYNYKFDLEMPYPVKISDVNEYGMIVRETTKNYYTVIKAI